MERNTKQRSDALERIKQHDNARKRQSGTGITKKRRHRQGKRTGSPGGSFGRVQPGKV